MPRYIVNVPTGGYTDATRLERVICQEVSAAAKVEDYEAMLERVTALRLADHELTAARDRALQQVARRVNDLQGHITARNYGLAEEAMTQLVQDLQDDQGPCYLVQKETR